MKPTDLEQVAREVDLECTGADDHDSPRCWKCERIRVEITAALRRVVREAADAVMDYRIKCDMPPDGSRTAVLAAFGLSEEG